MGIRRSTSGLSGGVEATLDLGLGAGLPCQERGPGFWMPWGHGVNGRLRGAPATDSPRTQFSRNQDPS